MWATTLDRARVTVDLFALFSHKVRITSATGTNAKVRLTSSRKSLTGDAVNIRSELPDLNVQPPNDEST